jgi:hypothetical protein
MWTFEPDKSLLKKPHQSEPSRRRHSQQDSDALHTSSSADNQDGKNSTLATVDMENTIATASHDTVSDNQLNAVDDNVRPKQSNEVTFAVTEGGTDKGESLRRAAAIRQTSRSQESALRPRSKFCILFVKFAPPCPYIILK